MTLTVVVADEIARAGLEILRQEPALEVVAAAGQPDLLAATLPRAHALIVRSETTVTAARMDSAPHLRVVGRAGVGVDNIDVAAATTRGIAVLVAGGGNTVSAAEHTIALMLSLLRRIPDAAASMRAGNWNRGRFQGSEASGKRLGVVGLGRVGRHVASIARALGMDVWAYDPYVSEDDARGLGVRLAALDELLAGVEVVTLHLPLTDETRGIIDAKRLDRMRPSAMLVNTARGGLVDHDALVQALEGGRLAGAALDVFEPEPLPPDAPLRGCDRVVLTPHLAASTIEAQERVAVAIAENVRDALTTGVRRGLVNVELSGG